MQLDKFNEELSSAYNKIFRISELQPLHFPEDVIGTHEFEISLHYEEQGDYLREKGFQLYDLSEDDDSDNILLTDGNIKLFEEILKDSDFKIIEVLTANGHFYEKGEDTFLIKGFYLYKKKTDSSLEEKSLILDNDFGITIDTFTDNLLVINATYLELYLKDEAYLDKYKIDYFYNKEYRTNFLKCTDNNIKVLTQYFSDCLNKINKDLMISQVQNHYVDDALILKRIRFRVSEK